MKQLGDKGLEMIRASMQHPEIRGCWVEIATSLPHRPQMAVYKRARILLYRSAERKWTQEEYEIVRRYHKFLLLRSYELYFILSIFMLALLI